MNFRAAVLHQAGHPPVVESVEACAVKPTDVVVRMKASGLCHTDLEIIQGVLKTPLPIVLGHEGAGIVETVGSEVTHVRKGDHVICSWNPNCGQCFYCVQDQPILCEVFNQNLLRGHLLDGTSRLRINGKILYHHALVSSHADFCILPEAGAIPVPKEIPFDRACVIGCGVMTGVGAVTRIAKVPVGSSITVFGCGAVGLNAIQASRLVHANPIIAVDIDDRKLALAQDFGATHTVNATLADTLDAVRSLTAGRGSDYTFEAAGSETTLQFALEAVRPGGHAVILGKVSFDSYVRLRFGSLMGEKQITRSAYGGARPSRDFPLLARWYLDGKLKLDELITDRIVLPDINKGFDNLRTGKGVRTVIMLN